MNETLNTLANKIRTEMGKIGASLRTALSHARTVGELLQKGKVAAKQAKSSWLDWLEKNVLFSLKTAQNYMRIAEDWDTLKGEPDFEAMNLSTALARLAGHTKPTTRGKRKTERKPGFRYLAIAPKPGFTVATILEVLRTMATVEDLDAAEPTLLPVPVTKAG